jgi:hypothetical protein
MKLVGGLIAGALLVGFGFSLGKTRPVVRSRRRHHRSFKVRSRFNPGYRRHRLEREMLAYIREGRELIRELRNPKAPSGPPQVDAEFYIQPGEARAGSGDAVGGPR